jgi:hypothetical protein
MNMNATSILPQNRPTHLSQLLVERNYRMDGTIPGPTKFSFPKNVWVNPAGDSVVMVKANGQWTTSPVKGKN